MDCSVARMVTCPPIVRISSPPVRSAVGSTVGIPSCNRGGRGYQQPSPRIIVSLGPFPAVAAAWSPWMSLSTCARPFARCTAFRDAPISGSSSGGRQTTPCSGSGRDADQQAQRLAITQALLGIATSLLVHISWRKPEVRALAVGAYHRLEQEHPHITQKAFCEAMALPTRTLRHWLAHPEPEAPASTSPVAPSPPALPPRKRPPRRPRSSFQVVLPDTQLAGDTTGLSAASSKAGSYGPISLHSGLCSRYTASCRAKTALGPRRCLVEFAGKTWGIMTGWGRIDRCLTSRT